MSALDRALNAPESLVQGAAPITLDEVQRAPRLLLAIEQAVDERRRPGRFLLTGSANLLLMRGVSESLAGRAVYLTLRPMTESEKRGDVDRQASMNDPSPSDPSRGLASSEVASWVGLSPFAIAERLSGRNDLAMAGLDLGGQPGWARDLVESEPEALTVRCFTRIASGGGGRLPFVALPTTRSSREDGGFVMRRSGKEAGSETPWWFVGGSLA